MSKSKDLLKNTIIIFFGTLCTKIISFFLLPLYTGILSTEEFGIVDLLSTYIALGVPIITLQIEQAVFRYLLDVREKSEKQKSVISTAFVFVILALSLLIISILFLFFIKPDIPFKTLLLSNFVISVFASLFLQITRGLGDNKAYAFGSFLIAALTVILNVILITAFKLGAKGLLISMFLANLISTIYLFVKQKLYKLISFKHFEKVQLKELLKYSVPLIPNAISWWMINASDRTIISFVLGIGANGIYSVANKFSSVYITLYNVFNIAWTESASLTIEDEDREVFFESIINKAFNGFSTLCIGVISVMPFIFNMFVNKSYSAAYQQIPILMLASLCNVVVGLISTVYVAKKLTKEVAKTSVLAAIINIGVNLVLVNKIGLYAASISTAAAYFTMMIFRYFDVQKYIKIRFNNTVIIFTILLMAFVLYVYYSTNLVLQICALGATVLYAIIINAKTMIQLLGFVKNKVFLAKKDVK